MSEAVLFESSDGKKLWGAVTLGYPKPAVIVIGKKA